MADYKNYNECSSPICSDSISIQIFSYPFCIDSGENVEISWKIENPNNVSLTVSDNRVEWFVNNAGGEKGSTESLNNSELYFAQLGKINNIGTLFFKIRTKINGSFYAGGNNWKSLEGFPDEITGDFQLRSPANPTFYGEIQRFREETIHKLIKVHGKIYN